MIAPDQSASREISVGRRRVNLVRLAQAQRLLLRLVLAMLGIYFTMMCYPSLVGGGRWPLGVLAVLFLIVAVLIVVQTVRLAISSGRNPVVAVIAGLFMLVPLLGLILVASADRRASKLLKQNGAKVGFLGVS